MHIHFTMAESSDAGSSEQDAPLGRITENRALGFPNEEDDTTLVLSGAQIWVALHQDTGNGSSEG